MISNTGEEFFDFFLANISRQTTALIDVVPLGYDWIGDLLLADIGQVVEKHPQGNQPPPDRRRCPAQTLLPLDKSIHIMYFYRFSKSAPRPFEKYVHLWHSAKLYWSLASADFSLGVPPDFTSSAYTSSYDRCGLSTG